MCCLHSSINGYGRKRITGRTNKDYINLNNIERPDGTSVKSSASGVGGMGSNTKLIKSPTRCHRCSLDVWALAQSRGDGHRLLVIPERLCILSEYNGDSIFCFIRNLN